MRSAPCIRASLVRRNGQGRTKEFLAQTTIFTNVYPKGVKNKGRIHDNQYREDVFRLPCSDAVVGAGKAGSDSRRLEMLMSADMHGWYSVRAPPREQALQSRVVECSGTDEQSRTTCSDFLFIAAQLSGNLVQIEYCKIRVPPRKNKGGCHHKCCQSAANETRTISSRPDKGAVDINRRVACLNARWLSSIVSST